MPGDQSAPQLIEYADLILADITKQYSYVPKDSTRGTFTPGFFDKRTQDLECGEAFEIHKNRLTEALLNKFETLGFKLLKQYMQCVNRSEIRFFYYISGLIQSKLISILQLSSKNIVVGYLAKSLAAFNALRDIPQLKDTRIDLLFGNALDCVGRLYNHETFEYDPIAQKPNVDIYTFIVINLPSKELFIPGGLTSMSQEDRKNTIFIDLIEDKIFTFDKIPTDHIFRRPIDVVKFHLQPQAVSFNKQDYDALSPEVKENAKGFAEEIKSCETIDALYKTLGATMMEEHLDPIFTVMNT